MTKTCLMTIAVQVTQRAARDEPLRFVIKPGGDANLLSGILAAYAGQPDARQVEIPFSGAADRADHLHDARADVGLLYAPFDDLTGEVFPRWPGMPDEGDGPEIADGAGLVCIARRENDHREHVAALITAAQRLSTAQTAGN
jgi:hypothetical protein